MGQTDILEFLSRDPENWFFASEISNSININRSSIHKALTRLVKNGEVQRKELPFSSSGKTPFLYKLSEKYRRS